MLGQDQNAREVVVLSRMLLLCKEREREREREREKCERVVREKWGRASDCFE